MLKLSSDFKKFVTDILLTIDSSDVVPTPLVEKCVQLYQDRRSYYLDDQFVVDMEMADFMWCASLGVRNFIEDIVYDGSSHEVKKGFLKFCLHSNCWAMKYYAKQMFNIENTDVSNLAYSVYRKLSTKENDFVSLKDLSLDDSLLIVNNNLYPPHIKLISVYNLCNYSHRLFEDSDNLKTQEVLGALLSNFNNPLVGDSPEWYSVCCRYISSMMHYSDEIEKSNHEMLKMFWNPVVTREVASQILKNEGKNGRNFIVNVVENDFYTLGKYILSDVLYNQV